MARGSHDSTQVPNHGELGPIPDRSTDDGLAHTQCLPPHPLPAACACLHIKFRLENISDTFPKDTKAQHVGGTYLTGSHPGSGMDE